MFGGLTLLAERQHDSSPARRGPEASGNRDGWSLTVSLSWNQAFMSANRPDRFPRPHVLCAGLHRALPWAPPGCAQRKVESFFSVAVNRSGRKEDDGGRNPVRYPAPKFRPRRGRRSVRNYRTGAGQNCPRSGRARAVKRRFGLAKRPESANGSGAARWRPVRDEINEAMPCAAGAARAGNQMLLAIEPVTELTDEHGPAFS